MALESINKQSRFEYLMSPSGELIYGTQEDLQAIGLGRGLAFPGEPGGPKRTLKITDPRGFPCKIEQAGFRGDGLFSASIIIPGRERDYFPEVEQYAPGVTLERLIWTDMYQGTSDSLINAGLVHATQFPGAEGLGKTITKFLPDGSPAPRGCKLSRLGAGSKSIRRATSRIFNLFVVIDQAEAKRRGDASISDRNDYELRMAYQPRPAPLVAPTSEAVAQARRSQMRLAWSAPENDAQRP